MADRPSLTGQFLYNATFWGGYAFFTAGFSFRRKGWANMPAAGPVLVVCNHQSMFDPVLVGMSQPRYLAFLARSDLFPQPVLGRLITALGAFPIDRGFGKQGVQSVLAALGQGRAVLMFPEGERTHTGAVQPLKAGVSLLVKRVTCPIVPVGIAGGFGAWSRFMKWPRPSPLFLPPGPSTIAVSVGEPLAPGRYAGKDRDWIVNDLYEAMVNQHAAAERLRRKPVTSSSPA
jgi:1-acyl-sn-glycerol-3-phosphate acyltransferase